MLYGRVKLITLDFRKYYSRYAGKRGGVSLAVGGSSLEKRLKGDGTRLEGKGEELQHCYPLPSPYPSLWWIL